MDYTAGGSLDDELIPEHLSCMFDVEGHRMRMSMPIHDWTRVDAGIFHAFHHGWIEELARALNRGVLPADYYALPEQHAAGFGPNVLTLQGSSWDEGGVGEAPTTSEVLMAPKLTPIAETDMEFYRRKQKSVTIRHVSGDRIVANYDAVGPFWRTGPPRFLARREPCAVCRPARLIPAAHSPKSNSRFPGASRHPDQMGA